MSKHTLCTTRIDKAFDENLYYAEPLVSLVREQISVLPRQEGTGMIREMELVSVPRRMKAKAGDIERIMKGNLNPFVNHLKANVTTNLGTIKQYIYVVRELHKFMGDKPIKDITKQDVDSFIVKLKEKYKQNSMVNRTAGLRHYIKYLGKEKEIDIKVAVSIQTKTEQDVLTEDEVLKLFQVTQDNKRDNCILKVLYYTGIRKSELINLNIEDIDFEGKQIIIQNGKGRNGQQEIINIHDQALESIKEYWKVRETPKPGYEKALFVSSYKRRICPSSIEYLIQDARAKAKIQKWVTCHMFRASLITHMHMNGASAFHIQQQSRHKSLDVLKGYIRPGKEQRLKTYESFVSTITETEVKQKPQEQPQEQPKPQEPQPQPKKKESEPDPMVSNIDDEIRFLENEQKLIRLRQAKENHRIKADVNYQ